MKKTALVIMAAGIGSRYGTGIKQLAKVGAHGEVIMEYSIHDALEAGFNKVVFIIRKDIEEEFRKVIGARIEKAAETEYVFQSLEDLPEGFEKPEDRTKPWGTGQAVLAARKYLTEPFVVINADDYYGKEAFVRVHEFLVEEHPAEEKLQLCMAGFLLGNTLSDNGSVTRGICRMNEQGYLEGVQETHNIVKTEEGAGICQEDGRIVPVDVRSLVSMNMWGLTPAFVEDLEKGFVEFLKELQPGELKKEYLLPIFIDKLIQEGRAQVRVLRTDDTWFGVTYQEDKPAVEAAFRELTDKGVYREKLFS